MAAHAEFSRKRRSKAEIEADKEARYSKIYAERTLSARMRRAEQAKSPTAEKERRMAKANIEQNVAEILMSKGAGGTAEVKGLDYNNLSMNMTVGVLETPWVPYGKEDPVEIRLVEQADVVEGTIQVDRVYFQARRPGNEDVVNAYYVGVTKGDFFTSSNESDDLSAMQDMLAEIGKLPDANPMVDMRVHRPIGTILTLLQE